MADDDLEVLVEDPPAPAPDPNEIGDPAKPAAAAKPVTKPEDGVDILKQQLKASQDEASANAARAEAAAARERLRAASRPARPWLHVTVSPRVARFLEAAGARRGSR